MALDGACTAVAAVRAARIAVVIGSWPGRTNRYAKIWYLQARNVGSDRVSVARHTIGGRGKARRVVKRVFLPPRATPRDAIIWNGKVKLRLPPTSSLKYILSDLQHDAPERDYLRQVIRETDVIADIGANIGFYTLWIAGLCVPQTKILSLEANPTVYASLVENIRLNEFDNVRAVHVAVGEKNGTVSFGMNIDRRSLGSVLAANAEQVVVPIRTLLSLLEEHKFGYCNIIKIDVEGYEGQVLLPLLR